MGASQSKNDEPAKVVTKAVSKVADKTSKAVDKTATKTSKAVDKVTTKAVSAINSLSKKVDKLAEPEPAKEDHKARDAVGVVGVVVVIAAVGAYLWKKKPWKKDEGKTA